ncbi:sigma-54-dependent Fis family transcriptional regulator [Photobacterium atrarenae]|uniref:Sigma-54-dependent Fis family transcriptional regulator n=1 Tax=Photobacterium atrarenae TaxID=865757 RepID=A0ABY5GJX9_9GAMM|nr:sigma-54-dependent Fis family transcriptional regulator [Photobacterium atrarenae]UTV29461.1 sigma-54-dependent Fis family transcriptional regulator [Photobacterium atrarenae]
MHPFPETDLSPWRDNWLEQSWRRSEQAGLAQQQAPEHVRLDQQQLSERQFHAQGLIRVVEQWALPLFNQMLAGSNSRLLLTDQEGVIIGAWGQSRFEQRLTSIALESGVCWQESLKGTNAIGTALADQRVVSVIGDQHFIRQHRFISCSAGPVFGPTGALLGVLDITSEQQVHSEQVRMLIQTMVQQVENALLCQIPNGKFRVDIACDSALFDSGWQGIVIADAGGRILAKNAVATRLLAQAKCAGEQLEALLARPQTGASAMMLPAGELVLNCQPLETSGHEPTPRSRVYSPSCPLHYGDDQIEQAWQQACKLINKDISLLILGETGVGKGEFVKQLHRHSQRHAGPLVAVNCGALPQELIESELFGYAPGAFTGASKQGYHGKVRQADGGILFLDEIADMPLAAQCRLLHVLQEKEVVPIGSNQAQQVDIQIIAATHKNLEQLVAEGLFRQDLYYRLNGLILTLPALRERQDRADLIAAIHRQHRHQAQEICPHLMQLLSTYAWPGNIRELDNVLRVATLLSDHAAQLTLAHLPQHIATPLVQQSQPRTAQASGTGKDLRTTLSDTLLETYRANKGNISKTARMLGISRNTLYRKLRKLGVRST